MTIMDSLPTEVLQLIVAYALPTVHPLEADFVHLRRSVHWVADLRRVNRNFKNALDDPMWFHVPKRLGLDPAEKMYPKGSYWDACKLLLAAEEQKQDAELFVHTVDRTRTHRPSPDRVIAATPSNHQIHPQPKRQSHVTMSSEAKERMSKCVTALESLLQSFMKDKHTLLRNNELQRWPESALNRYRMFLHLKLANPSVWLVPTLDIELCWLTHIFCTETYWRDMAALGISPQYSLCLSSYGEVASFSKAVRATESLWNKTYGDKFPFLHPGTNTLWPVWRVNENNKEVYRDDPPSYFPRLGPEILTLPLALPLPSISLTPEDIQVDLQWLPGLQEAFNEWESLHNARPGIVSNVIRQQALSSYERFLNVCSQGTLENPPAVLDLVWRAHQVDPVRYKEDCLQLFGRKFLHCPWPNGLGITTPVSEDFQRLWSDAYETLMTDDWKYRLRDQDSHEDVRSE